MKKKNLLTLIANVNARKILSSALQIDWRGAITLAYLHSIFVNFEEKKLLTLISDINVRKHYFFITLTKLKGPNAISYKAFLSLHHLQR
jgi:hypothetical protein